MKQEAGKRISEAEADRGHGRVDLWQLQGGTKTSWRMSWGTCVCRASVHACVHLFTRVCMHACICAGVCISVCACTVTEAYQTF